MTHSNCTFLATSLPQGINWGENNCHKIIQPPLGSTDATEYHLSEKLWMVSVITFSPVVFELWAPPVGHKATACVACIAMQGEKNWGKSNEIKEFWSYYLSYHDFIYTLDPFLLILTDQNWVEWKSREFYWIFKHFWLIWGVPKKGFRDTIIGVNSAFDSSAKYQFKSQFGKNAKILAAKEIWRSTLKLFKC